MTAPQRFRSRPQTVEAVQWRGEANWLEVHAFLGRNPYAYGNFGCPLSFAVGRGGAEHGDWIVQHEPGRFEVLTDAEFRAAYEPDEAATQ